MVKNDYSLYEMLTKGHIKHFDNCLVRFLSGQVLKDFGTIDEVDFAKAKHNFDTYFQHFGLNEYFDESVLILSYELHWKFPFYAKINTTGKKKINHIEGEETKEALEKCTRYDSMLYDYAQRKFAIKLEQHRERLEKDKLKLRAGNKQRNFWLKLHYLMHEKR